MSDKLEFGWSSLPGELLKRWPSKENGEPVEPAYLVHCRSNDMEDIMVVTMLEAYGIPALRVYPGDGSFGAVVLGMSGTGADIYVPETLADDARALMEADIDDELQS